jgi:hypothetical protein
VNLYFDKATGLLLRTECLVKDLESSGRELVVETLYDDYRKVGGLPVAHKRDGKPIFVSENSDVRLAEKLDDGTFEKPGS